MGDSARASYRIDYVMTNELMTHMVKDAGIVPTNQFHWSSDHKVTWTTMVGWRELGQVLGRLKKRQIYDPRDVSKHKGEMEMAVEGMIREAKNKGDGLKQVEGEVKEWMGENLHKTRKYKSFSEKGKMTDDGVRWKMVMDLVLEAIGCKKCDKAVDLMKKVIELSLNLVVCEKSSKQELVEMLRMVRSGKINQIVLPMWLGKLKKVVDKELKRAMWDGKKMAGMAWKAEVAGGEMYMPWAKLVFNQGKTWKLPDMGIVSLMNAQGQLVMGVEKMEVIMSYMQKQWAVVNAGVKKEFIFARKASKEDMEMVNAVVSGEEVRRVARKLKRDKSPGSDLIPNEAWKYMGQGEYEWMASKFTSILQGVEPVPKEWKTMVVKWIYKKDSMLALTNYRPIALGNTLSKLFMRVLTERIERLVERGQLVSGEQQGFRTDRSCMGALFMLRRMAAKADVRQEPFLVASLDISKAYDTVSHEALWAVL